jgi:S-adenosylmethionine hydrolase
MRQPLITLTTDFGLRGHFAGAMKGVILRIEPRARIVDISHEVAPYAIAEGAFALAQAYRWFPAGTIHVAVVDPGVGTPRRPLLVQAAGQFFVAPDNGLLSMIYAREKHRVRAVSAEKFFLKPVSRTFHGRDVFAPVAAHLARGVKPPQFGKLISDYRRSGFGMPVQTSEKTWEGAVLVVDRFGNLTTNFPVEEFRAILAGRFEVSVGTGLVRRYASSYEAGGEGELFVIEGSSGYLEIASRQASAAQLTNCAAEAKVQLAIE